MSTSKSNKISNFISKKKHGTKSVKFLDTGRKSNANVSAIVGLDKHFYVFWGLDGNNITYGPTNKCWVYYYDGNTWESLPPKKDKLLGCRAALAKEKCTLLEDIIMKMGINILHQ